MGLGSIFHDSAKVIFIVFVVKDDLHIHIFEILNFILELAIHNFIKMILRMFVNWYTGIGRMNREQMSFAHDSFVRYNYKLIVFIGNIP